MSLLYYVSKILSDAICHFCAMYPRLWEGREMFYLTTHSTHFIYSYMASGLCGMQYVTSELCIQDSGTQYVTSVLCSQDSVGHNMSPLCYVAKILCYVSKILWDTICHLCAMYPRFCGTQYVTSELCIQDSVLCIQDSVLCIQDSVLCIQDSVGHNMSLLCYISKTLGHTISHFCAMYPRFCGTQYVTSELCIQDSVLCIQDSVLCIQDSVLCIQDSVGHNMSLLCYISKTLGHTISHFCAMYPRFCGTQYVTSVLYIQDSGTHNMSPLCYVSRTLSKSCFVNTRTLPAKSSVRSRWVSGELWAMSHSSGCRNCVGVWRWSVSPALRWAEWASRRVVGALAGRDLRSRRSVSSPGTVALMFTLARSFDLITS